MLGLFHCHVRCAIALTDNLLLFKAQLDARRGCLIEVPQDLTEVRIRSESIFSASFKAKAFSPFLPTFFHTQVVQFHKYSAELRCGLLHYGCNWIHKSNYGSLWEEQLTHRFKFFIIFPLFILHIPKPETAG